MLSVIAMGMMSKLCPFPTLQLYVEDLRNLEQEALQCYLQVVIRVWERVGSVSRTMEQTAALFCLDFQLLA